MRGFIARPVMPFIGAGAGSGNGWDADAHPFVHEVSGSRLDVFILWGRVDALRLLLPEEN